MKSIERKRLNYKPNLYIDRKIHSYYTENGIVKYEKNNFSSYDNDKLSESIKDFSQFNIGEILENGSYLFSDIENLLKGLEERLIIKDEYKELPSAFKDNDIAKMKYYYNIFDDLNTDILAEIYPFILSVYSDLNKLMYFIKERIINDNELYNDVNLLKEISSKHINELKILESNDMHNNINYKLININTTIYNLINDRFKNLNNIANTVVSLYKDNTINNIEKGLLNTSYYDIMKLVREEHIKMTIYNSSNNVINLLNKIYDNKVDILKNRDLLKDSTQSKFTDIIGYIKNLEGQFEDSIVDLYRANLIDLLSKNDYIESLKKKQKLRLSIQAIG